MFNYKNFLIHPGDKLLVLGAHPSDTTNLATRLPTQMALTSDVLKKILQQQQVQFETAQSRLIKMMTECFSLHTEKSESNGISNDTIANSITEFTYDPDAGMFFESWFKRYEDIFNIELKNQDDAWRVRLLLRKLCTTEHARYTNSILPKNARDLSFKDTVKQLSEIFGERSSLFNIRYQCMKLIKGDEDFVTYAGKVNVQSYSLPKTGICLTMNS